VYFIPRNNKIYSLLAVAPIYWLYIGTVVAGAAIVFTWWSFLYVPMSVRTQSLQLEHMHMSQQQLLFPHLRDDVKKLEQTTKELAATVNYALEESELRGDTLGNIVAKSAEAGLNLISCMPKAVEYKDWYTIHPVDMQCSGTFDAVQRFLKTLALHDYPMHLSHITIRKQGDTLLLQCHFNVLGIHDSQALS
jgi:hypothetical protein